MPRTSRAAWRATGSSSWGYRRLSTDPLRDPEGAAFDADDAQVPRRRVSPPARMSQSHERRRLRGAADDARSGRQASVRRRLIASHLAPASVVQQHSSSVVPSRQQPTACPAKRYAHVADGVAAGMARVAVPLIEPRAAPRLRTALPARPAAPASAGSRCPGFFGRYTKVNRCLTEGRQALTVRMAGIEGGIECARLAPLLSALADGEADAQALAVLRPHMKTCLSCRARLREFRAAPARVAALLPPAVLLTSDAERGGLRGMVEAALGAGQGGGRGGRGAPEGRGPARRDPAEGRRPRRARPRRGRAGHRPEARGGGRERRRPRRRRHGGRPVREPPRAAATAGRRTDRGRPRTASGRERAHLHGAACDDRARGPRHAAHRTGARARARATPAARHGRRVHAGGGRRRRPGGRRRLRRATCAARAERVRALGIRPMSFGRTSSQRGRARTARPPKESKWAMSSSI